MAFPLHKDKVKCHSNAQDAKRVTKVTAAGAAPAWAAVPAEEDLESMIVAECHGWVPPSPTELFVRTLRDKEDPAAARGV